jgi:hypothetical protein
LRSVKRLRLILLDACRDNPFPDRMRSDRNPMRHLAEPAIDIRIALGRVRDDVLAMTGGRQEPFIYGSLGGATITIVPLSALSAAEKIEPLPESLPPPVANAKQGRATSGTAACGSGPGPNREIREGAYVRTSAITGTALAGEHQC